MNGTAAAENLWQALESYCAISHNARTDAPAVSKLVELSAAAVEDVIRQTAAPGGQWLYIRVPVEAIQPREIIMRYIAPMVEELRERCAVGGFWWLNKTDVLGPAVRVRIEAPIEHHAELARTLLAELEKSGLSANTVRYEPELRLFGGRAGMDLAHRIFCADSAFLVEWLAARSPAQAAIPEGLSLALCLWLLASAGLDLFESWDVFGQICNLRPWNRPASETLSAECRRIADKVLDSGPEALIDSVARRGKAFGSGYKRELQALGRQVEERYFTGELTCGRREFLVPIVLFHWNRAGLPAATQGALAAAAEDRLRRMVHGT